MSRKRKTSASETQAINKRLKEQTWQQKYFQKLRNAQKKERDRILVRTMKLASGKDIYTPKEFKLTKYRRYRATKAAKEFGEFLDPKKYFFVKAPKKAKKQIVSRAEQLQMKYTRAGVFIEKGGHTRVKLIESKRRNEYAIVRSGKTKRGPTKGRRYTTLTPLASIDDLANEKQRIRDMANSLGRLKKGEFLTFKVVENGFEGFHGTLYSNIDLLLLALENYKKTMAAKINFFRHIEIVKTSGTIWFASHPGTNPGPSGRKQRDQIRAREKVAKHGKTNKKGRSM